MKKRVRRIEEGEKFHPPYYYNPFFSHCNFKDGRCVSNDLTEEEEDATLHIITIHLIFAPIFLQSILAAVILKMVAVWVVI